MSVFDRNIHKDKKTTVVSSGGSLYCRDINYNYGSRSKTQPLVEGIHSYKYRL